MKARMTNSDKKNTRKISQLEVVIQKNCLTGSSRRNNKISICWLGKNVFPHVPVTGSSICSQLRLINQRVVRRLQLSQLPDKFRLKRFHLSRTALRQGKPMLKQHSWQLKPTSGWCRDMPTKLKMRTFIQSTSLRHLLQPKQRGSHSLLTIESFTRLAIVSRRKRCSK
jgi:hypothetical protein